MNKTLIELLNYISTACEKSQTEYKLKCFKEAEAIEIYFKSANQERRSQDFIQVNDYGIHYWNEYKEEYTTLTYAEAILIINTVFI